MRPISEMNKGVQILLQRMESHPQEFVPDLHSEYPHKWRMLLRKVDNRIQQLKTKGIERKLDNTGIYIPDLSFLEDDEIQALHSKLQSIRGDLFTKEVMNTLLVAEEEEQTELSFSSIQGLGGSTKFSLTRTQIQVAKQLGMSPLEYAKSLEAR